MVQVYEMYVAGYSFKLLNNAFTSHWGFQVLHLLKAVSPIFHSELEKPAKVALPTADGQ